MALQNAENPVTQMPKAGIKGPSGYLADVTTANELKVQVSGTSLVTAQTVSEGPTGAAVPADATLIGGQGPTGNLTAIHTDASGDMLVVQPFSSTASAPAATSVTGSSGSILASNTSRKQCIVVNTGITVVYLGLGQTPTTSAYHVALAACTSANDGTGGSFISEVWQGAINAIAASSGTVVVTELT